MYHISEHSPYIACALPKALLAELRILAGSESLEQLIATRPLGMEGEVCDQLLR